MSHPPVHRDRGFTLIELLVTAALVGVLASVALPATEMIVQRTRENALREHLRDIRTAIDAYKQASDSGRIATTVGESGYPRSLDDLLGAPDIRDPNGGSIRFLRKIPRDPLHTDQAVAAGKTWGLRSYASSHQHPQAGKDVYDVYSTAAGHGINGTPYRDW